nr:MAG TPA: hypothetical protein [Inoviridae sp.]
MYVCQYVFVIFYDFVAVVASLLRSPVFRKKKNFF